MKNAYLLINFFTVLFPVLLSFDRRVQFYKSWKYIAPGMLITGLIFLFWDVLFVQKGIWSFNPDYVTGINVFQLPVEEVLFFITVPFACLFIYACLNYYVERSIPAVTAKFISALLAGLSVMLLIFYHARLYTAITFGLLLAVIIVLQFIIKASWLGRFYVAYAVSLIPFYIVNGILTAIPIVLYNNQENMALRIGTIPFEDHFYSLALLLLNAGFFEYFKRRWNR